jgi:hypothetical protein
MVIPNSLSVQEFRNWTRLPVTDPNRNLWMLFSLDLPCTKAINCMHNREVPAIVLAARSITETTLPISVQLCAKLKVRMSPYLIN